MAEQIEISLKTERKPEAEEVLQLLDEMSPAEQQKFLVFMQGVIFAKGLERKRTDATAQPV